MLIYSTIGKIFQLFSILVDDDPQSSSDLWNLEISIWQQSSFTWN